MDVEFRKASEVGQRHKVEGTNYDLGHGDVVLAAITSCTNTSNPSVMIGRAPRPQRRRQGPQDEAWVKTSLAPGSQVVAEYFEKSGLQTDLDALGFNLVGFGCELHRQFRAADPGGVEGDQRQRPRGLLGPVGQPQLRGPREPGRAGELPRLAAPRGGLRARGIHAGGPRQRPLGTGADGKPVYPSDIWPTSAEIQDFIDRTVTSELFATRYADVFTGDERWRAVEVSGGLTFEWDSGSTYVQNPPYFEGMTKEPKPVTDIVNARVLGLFLDLDHHRPHLAGGQHPGRLAGRQVPAGAPTSPSPTSTSTARGAATTRS